jgi:Flp pilus assembly protein TadG
MVTAELAACLPVLVLMLAVVLTAESVVAARVRLQDAAREAARASARGDPAAAHLLAGKAAPGASVEVSSGSDDVVAIARLQVHPLGAWLPALTITERAVAAVEPTSGSP